MRRYVYEAVVDTPADKLWRTIVDVRRWPEWDEGLEAIELQGELAPGRRYTLKPRGGPAVRMSVEAMDPLAVSSTWPICPSRRCGGRTSSAPSRGNSNPRDH